MNTEHWVVVGAGMACGLLLEALKNRGCSAALTVIGDESDACYNRVLLSNYLAGRVTESDLYVAESASHELNIRWRCGAPVSSIHRDRREVELASGECLQYDKVILSTGASTAVPALLDTAVQGVQSFRTLDDARSLLSKQSNPPRVVVLGGGLLGLEAAEGMRSMGCKTTLVHRNQSLMNRQLDSGAADLLRRILESRGMTMHCGAGLDKLEIDAGVLTGVHLDSGEFLPAELLIVATGIRPRVDLANSCGLKVDHGIVVDDRLCSSDPNVFAIGECSQVGTATFGMVAPIREQADTLAATLCGEQLAFAPTDVPVQLKIADIELFAVGARSGNSHRCVSDPESGVYRCLYFDDEALVGAVLLGDIRGSSLYERLVGESISIDTQDPQLMFQPQAFEVSGTSHAQAA